MDIRKPPFLQKMPSENQKKTESSGTRQGCPLSPCLFVLVMICISEDIKSEISEEAMMNRIPGLKFDMIFYAEDTILYSLNKAAIEELLEKVKIISKKYGLALNKDKCVNLNMNTSEEQVFADGKRLRGKQAQCT